MEKSDSEAVVRALEQAHLKWECGDRTSALDLVRAASEAALAAGMKDRALALTKASAALGRELEPGTRRTPPPATSPQVSKKLVLESVVAASRETRRAPRTSAPVQSAPVRSAPAGAAAQGAPPKPSAAPRAQVARAAPTAKPPAARSRSAPSIEVSGLDAPDETGDLLVTVAASDWQTGVQVAVVGRRAERVVVEKTRRPDGTLEVRPLAPGEVAPRGAQIALLVSLGDPE